MIRRDRAQGEQGVVVGGVKDQAEGVVAVVGRGRVPVDEPGGRARDLRTKQPNEPMGARGFWPVVVEENTHTDR